MFRFLGDPEANQRYNTSMTQCLKWVCLEMGYAPKTAKGPRMISHEIEVRETQGYFFAREP